MLKRQQSKDNESDETESSVSKCQRLDVYNDKKRQGLDKYKSEGEGKIHIHFLYMAYLLPPPKESNLLINLVEETRSLNHLIYIIKICYLEKC